MTNTIPGDGPIPAYWMAIGEAPGYEEDRLGIPFIGPSGKEVRYNLLALADIDDRDVYFTNVFKQRPPNNRKPTKAEITSGLVALHAEISQVNPAIIFLLGDTALQIFFPGEKIGMVHGVPRHKGNVTLVPMYHPAAMLHNPKLRATVEEDWRRIRDKLATTDASCSTVVLPVEGIIFGDMMSVDTETLMDGTLVNMSASVKSGQAYWGKFDVICDTLLMHNSKFDLPVLEKANRKIQYRTLIDTMLAAYILGEEQLGLKPLCVRYFGKDMKHLKELLDEQRTISISSWLSNITNSAHKVYAQNMTKKRANVLRQYQKDIAIANITTLSRRPKLRQRLEAIGGPMPEVTVANIPDDKLSQYGGEDADMTRRLWTEKLQPQLSDKEMSLLLNIEMPLVPILISMETRGIGIDHDWFASRKIVGEDTIDKIRYSIYNIVGDSSINLNSPQQLETLLFDKLRLPPVEWTASGRASTGKKALLALKDRHEVIPLISRYKLLSKELDFVDKFLSCGDRVYPRYNQVRRPDVGDEDDAEGATVTGRLSSSDPNLQQISPSIRDGFVPRPGHIFISADYSQIEPRIMAHMAQDTALLDAFNSGHNPYSYVGSLIFDKPVDSIVKGTTEYNAAKWVLLGTNYGLTEFGLSLRLGCSIEKAREVIYKYLNQFPGIVTYMNNVTQFYKANGYTETLFGRRRWINTNDEGMARRQAINHPIQGTAADILKIAMGRATDLCLVASIHDELLIESPTDQMLSNIAKLKVAMLDNICDLAVPLSVSVSMGQRWGSISSESREIEDAEV